MRTLSLGLALCLLPLACGDGASGGGGSGGAVIPEGHPRIWLNEANRTRLGASLDAGAAAATRFQDMVDDQLGGADYYAFQASDAALLGALGRGAAYCPYAIGMVDAAVAAEEDIIAGGGEAEVSFDSYLYVGETVGVLSLVFDWCHAELSDDQKTRWIEYANQAVWNVWHPDEANWGGVTYPWSGWSIDNPSNNYHYSFLRATMLLGLATQGENDEADGWIDLFRNDKMETLFATFESDLQGGGSREGTGYGVSHRELFRLYDQWEATTGERLWDHTAHTKASLPDFLALTVPTMDRIAPIGDHARDSTASLFDYHRTYVLILQYLLGPDDPLAQAAQTFLDDCSVPEMSQAFLFVDDFAYYSPDHPKAPLSSLHPAYHSPGTGSVFFRSDWTQGATWGAFQAGPFTESHAHRDQGSFLVYRGEWLAFDENILSHSGIVQDEAAHNLVRIEAGGETVQQQNGSSELAALVETPDFLYLAADVTPIYDGAPEVVLSQREVLFVKPDVFVIFDRVELGAGAEAIYQLQTPIQPAQAGDVFTIQGGSGALELRSAGPVTTSVFDWTADPDMSGGFRIELRDSAGGSSPRFATVLAPPGRVVSAALAGTTVSVVLDDGTTLDAAFAAGDLGVDLQLDGPSGNLHSGAVPLEVQTLPVVD